METKGRIKIVADGVILKYLRKSWFDLVEQEDYPNTPKITKELDDLEKTIARTKDKINENP